MATSTMTVRSSVAGVEPGAGDRGQRGRLRIEHRVVQKIATRAAGEIAGVVGHRRGMFGIGNRDRQPHVEVSSDGGSVVVAIGIGLPFPAPIQESAAAVQNRVAAQVGRLTGAPVRRVDVTVTWLDAGDDKDRRLA